MLELLYEATNSKLGIVIQTSDPQRLRAKLYTLRRDNEDFQCLSFVPSPLVPDHLWIIKRSENGRSPD